VDPRAEAYVEIEEAEKYLDRFVEKRARSKKADDDRWWEASHRLAAARQREARRQEWLAYYEHMNKLHLDLAAEHADKRSRLMIEGGYELEKENE
jgi:hypothetical protein